MNSSTKEQQIEWTGYYFEPFGLHCQIFQATDVAIMIDPRTPLEGYLAQSRGPVMLIISYGLDSGLDNWTQRLLSHHGKRATIYEERKSATLCAHPAERLVLKIEPELPAHGYGFKDGVIQELSAGDDEPYLMIMMGTTHRQTPLVAIFRRPLAQAPWHESAEKHFFNSFYCDLE